MKEHYWGLPNQDKIIYPTFGAKIQPWVIAKVVDFNGLKCALMKYEDFSPIYDWSYLTWMHYEQTIIQKCFNIPELRYTFRNFYTGWYKQIHFTCIVTANCEKKTYFANNQFNNIMNIVNRVKEQTLSQFERYHVTTPPYLRISPWYIIIFLNISTPWIKQKRFFFCCFFVFVFFF